MGVLYKNFGYPELLLTSSLLHRRTMDYEYHYLLLCATMKLKATFSEEVTAYSLI